MFDTTYKKNRTLALMAVLTAVLPLMAFGESVGAAGAKATQFVNVADTTQGFSSFGSAPAINNTLAVAFESTGTGFESGSVWRWYNGTLTPIATSANGKLHRFGDVVTINSAGLVGFSAGVISPNDSIIAEGDGGALNVIASASAAGLVGGQFLGISGMNERGEVIFLGVRTGFRSRAIFSGKGGPLTAIVDTATDSNLAFLGNADINAAGRVAFRAFLVDGTEGIFLAGDSYKDLIDTTNPNLADFLDPVINNGGTVGSAAFLSAGGQAAFTADAKGVTARTDSSSFSFIDNVSINNSGDIAFFATDTIGRDGIFVESAGSSNPVPVIGTGDSLFGSTVVAFSIGRFCLNDDGWITFRYLLADGRSGIAVASRQF